jgi:hypothetical protein
MDAEFRGVWRDPVLWRVVGLAVGMWLAVVVLAWCIASVGWYLWRKVWRSS